MAKPTDALLQNLNLIQTLQRTNAAAAKSAQGLRSTIADCLKKMAAAAAFKRGDEPADLAPPPKLEPLDCDLDACTAAAEPKPTVDQAALHVW